MNAKTKKRCEQLGAEANTTANEWIAKFPNDYSGKVRFSLALATAISVIRSITPGLENTGQDFISAVKAGTVLWVEGGEK